MTEQSLDEIEVGSISPSPFQHRRVFDDAGLRELAKSIEQDGLIQPITVRPHEGGYELIAGERRWRAVRKFTALKTIQARVLHVNDLQARRLCATENLQRADLTSLEEVLALAELVDASMLEFSGDYAPLSPVQEPKWRVKSVLSKLNSDRANKTNYFIPKFGDKIEEIFSGLPKPKDARKFLENDLVLLFTPAEVQEFALKHRLNKSQTKAVNEMSKAAPAVFKSLAESEQGNIVKTITRMATPVHSYSPQDEEENDSVETVADLSADTISRATRNYQAENKKLQRHLMIEEQAASIAESSPEVPVGPFHVICIDPPWPYGTPYDPNGRRAANPYPEMSLEQIRELNIPAADDCILWLWTTHKFMRHSFSLLDAWGFRDVAILTWAKDRMGLGSWLRSQSEFCIMSVKGTPPINLSNQTTIISGPLREHSRKPDSFYALVESLCVGAKLDYFSRESRPGWHQFGNTTNLFDGKNQ